MCAVHMFPLKMEVVQVLLEAGADVNVQDKVSCRQHFMTTGHY